jgi:hypothetical protein
MRHASDHEWSLSALIEAAARFISIFLRVRLTLGNSQSHFNRRPVSSRQDTARHREPLLGPHVAPESVRQGFIYLSRMAAFPLTLEWEQVALPVANKWPGDGQRHRHQRQVHSRDGCDADGDAGRHGKVLGRAGPHRLDGQRRSCSRAQGPRRETQRVADLPRLAGTGGGRAR